MDETTEIVAVREFSKPAIKTSVAGNTNFVKSFVDSCRMHYTRFSNTFQTFDVEVRKAKKEKELAGKPDTQIKPTVDSGLSNITCNDNYIFKFR